MKIAQATGPFNGVVFNGTNTTTDQYGYWMGMPKSGLNLYKCIHIGVQAPQSPYMSQCDDLSQMNSINIIISNANKMFKINANEIIEFDDIEILLSDLAISTNRKMDEYTIIDIGFEPV